MEFPDVRSFGMDVRHVNVATGLFATSDASTD
jgi:hypothetical protein